MDEDEVTTTTQNPVEAMISSPKKTVTEEGSVEERDLKDILAAQRYLDQKNAPAGPFYGIRIGLMKPPGTT